jgi:hypothetical protein
MGQRGGGVTNIFGGEGGLGRGVCSGEQGLLRRIFGSIVVRSMLSGGCFLLPFLRWLFSAFSRVGRRCQKGERRGRY